MAQQIGKLQTLTGGISTISSKLGPPNSFSWGRSVDFRSDPAQQTAYPQSKKISGSIVTDLPMFADVAGEKLYFHGNTGNIYSVDTNDTVTKEYTVPNSSGNGIVYFAETGQLYIPTNNSITRRDNAIGDGNYYNNFLETSGGTPTNTMAILLVAASSQSATRASTASLQLAGDMTLEAYLKPTSLPTGTNKMSIISKWDESGSKLGYKLDIITTSAAFGDGSDGTLTVSVSATEAPIDGNCTGTAGTNTLTVSNVTGSFATGQKIYIHQSRGANHGTKQITSIIGVSGSVLTLADNLSFSPTHSATTSVAEKAQVRVIKQYSGGTINTGVTLTVKAWDGLKGGLGLIDDFTGTLTVNGHIVGDGCGFRGGTSTSNNSNQTQGEGYAGLGSRSSSANGNGGGAGIDFENNAAGGGGSQTAGGTGTMRPGKFPSNSGAGGLASGSADNSLVDLGGGGGATAYGGGHGGSGIPGAPGGAIIEIWAANFVMGVSGSISSNGLTGSVVFEGASGPGAGGPITLHVQTATLGTNQITSNGGATVTGGGSPSITSGTASGGNLYGAYYTSISGTTTPTLISAQDDSLGIANGYALRLYISSDGSTFETYTQNIDDFTGVYKFYSVSWQASTSTAIFYENAQSIGTKVGTKTAINTNAAIFGIGCYVNSGSTKTGFFDGLVDDVRIWVGVRSAAQIVNYYNQILSGSEANLVAYYPFDGTVNDSQVSGLNNLTANNSPTYLADVAFKGVTTRGDEDVFLNHTGFTYTLKTALSETSTDKIPFTPTREPFKSLALNINTVSSGTITVTVHDELNDVVATMTVTHANQQTGIFEFKFPNSERIILNANYHIHVFDTTGDGKVVTATASDLSTAYLKTYYQILVDDIYHDSVQFQNFVCIANERYLAVLQAGNVYDPARLIFPSGYRIRKLAFWQQYLVIGMWFGDNITDTDTGKLFFWDGNSDTYIDELDVPQGGINAMLGTQGGLLISAGYKGAMLEYTGYPSSFRYTARTSAQLAFRLPNVVEGDTVEIAPGAMTMWNSMNRIGVSLNTNSSTLHQGVYTYGQYTDSDPMSVGFDYPLSIGDNMNNMVKIGCLFTRGAKLYTGFQNSNTFGIDVVDEENPPYTTATLEFLITDLGSVAAKKLPFVFRSDFLPLTAGQSVSIKYKPNRASTWVTLVTQLKVGATDVRAIINNRLKEAQFAVDWVNTTLPVTFTQHTLESDDESDSRQT